ncbi:HAD family hydrolase [uncultured Tessaracoccus sp.]|uniref:HAD family hydrolase n=1 Tax=uncultured Tessaracoccus sp. TaxID=905023 RepID=UPI0025D76900|nr:HAD family hydrolase [uncultured Tessaracoccus sp.]
MRFDGVHLIVDYGGVVCHPAPDDTFDRFAEAAGAEPGPVRERYWAHRDAYDRGASADEFWRAVLDRDEVPADVVEALSQIDVESWSHLQDGTVALLRRCHDEGATITVLSNAPHDMGAHVRSLPALQEVAGDVLISSALGCAKPDPEIFRLAKGRAPAARLHVMIDDREPNVEAAAKEGIEPVVFQSPTQLGAALDALVG